MASVSVIIPCYNGERYLAEAIESILAQTYPVTEIILVDDVSTDNSKAVVARYPQVKCVYLDVNQGPPGAMNRGIVESTGEYIVLLDQDDRLLPRAIEIGVRELENHPDCMFSFGPCRLIDEHGQPYPGGRKILEQPVRGSIYQTLLQGTCLNPVGRHVIRRALFDKIGYLDASMRSAFDYDFYLRAVKTFPAVSHDEPVVEYREHSESVSQSTRSSKHLRQFLTIYSRQNNFVKNNPEYAAAYTKGLNHWTSMLAHDYLFYEVLTCLKEGKFKEAISVLLLVLRYNPGGIMKVIAKTITPA
jgi:glycosyltransferase involved in cell wall biosynthesis